MTLTDFLSTIFIALSLSVDCFAVALCGSLSRKTISLKPVLRMSFSFGFFQTVMPVIGWFIGRTIIDLIAGYDHWAAFVLLAGVGARMLWESTRRREECDSSADITRGLLLLTLSVATSIDALAAGLSFALIKIDILTASLTIGAVAFAITAIGFYTGSRVGALVSRRAKAIGGVILIAIGLRILLSHLLG